ncbi:hypothetical protein JKF63_00090 [Porcisia hertigi]|uniref:Uncharacterized protein n=1 Tax=Porcisia hertigi TaxID=2761500 RepID=A0A836I4C9_9TRYP|nr:hypothetical protein JKF63_00090 [Porcisia hertigi]
MQTKERAPLVLSMLAGKVTVGTMWLRFFGAVLILSSSVAAMLYMVVLGIDEVYALQNSENVYTTRDALDTNSDALSATPSTAASPTLLFPQLRASIGLYTVCVSGNCFRRSSFSGVLPLVDNTAHSVTRLDLPEPVRLAYQEAAYQYVFGFDIGVHCGMPRRKSRSLGHYGLAAVVLSLILLIALFSTGMILCSLVNDTDVLIGKPKLDSELHVVTVDVFGLPAPYMTRKINRHLRWSQPVLYSAGVLSLLAFSMSVCAMGVTVALARSHSKCGKSVCVAFEQGMRNFYQTATSLGVGISAPRDYSCHTGSSYILVVTAVPLSFFCAVASAALLMCYKRSGRREKMLAMRDELSRLTEMQLSTRARSISAVHSRQVSAFFDASFLTLPFSPSVRRASKAFRGEPSSDLCSQPQSCNPLGTTQYAAHHGCGLGSCMEVNRQVNQLIADEAQQDQGCIEVDEFVEERPLSTLQEAMKSSQDAFTLYNPTLVVYADLVKELCLLETHSRHQLIRDYEAGVAEVAALVREGARVLTPVPSQLQRERAALEERERCMRKQITQRWWHVYVHMYWIYQRTVSHTAASQQLLRGSISVKHRERAVCARLDADRSPWRLEGLCATPADAHLRADPLSELLLDTKAFYPERNVSDTFSCPTDSDALFSSVSGISYDNVQELELRTCAGSV